MNTRLALNTLRAFLVLAFALLAGFVIFCLALSAQAAPAAKTVKPARPVIKIGHAYRAEKRRKAQKHRKLVPLRPVPCYYPPWMDEDWVA